MTICRELSVHPFILSLVGPIFLPIQWRIQEKGPGGPALPLFLDQAEARGGETIFLETAPAPF